MGTHPIFESDFDCLTERLTIIVKMLRNLARPVQMTVSRRPLSVGQFWKSLPGLEKVFFISAGSVCSDRSLFDRQGRARSRWCWWCRRQEGPYAIIVIQITSYLLVPPTQCLFS